jgi:hypothetical protein
MLAWHVPLSWLATIAGGCVRVGDLKSDAAARFRPHIAISALSGGYRYPRRPARDVPPAVRRDMRLAIADL